MMGADSTTDWRAAAASALDWWAEAGVDLVVDDLPRDWLAPPAALPAAPMLMQAAGAGAMPDQWEAFVAWRAGAAAPETGWRGAHLAASGPADASVMVLVDCPDSDDAEGGQLMAGQSGRLFNRMLRAIGMTRDEVHLASVCCKRPAAGRMPRDCEDQLTGIARHHVGLIAPKRLLLLGNAASRAVIGTDVQPGRGSLHPFSHKTGTTEVVVSFHPRLLLERPMVKAEAWKDLQLLMKDIGK